MSELTDRLKQFAPAIIDASLMFFFAMAVYYPGIFSFDSVSQYEEARSLFFTDLHAPGMALLWSWLNHIPLGPVVVLVFNNLVFWTALCLFSLWLFPTSILMQITFVFVVGMFPPIFTQLGLILEDIPCFSLLFFACTLLLFANVTAKRWVRWLLVLVVGGLLFYATLFRHNAILAIPPICFWIVAVLTRGEKICFPKIIVFILGILLFTAVFLGNRLLVNNLVKGRTYYPVQMFQLYDIIGISVAKQKVMLPEYLIKRNHPTIMDLEKIYMPTSDNFSGSYWDYDKKNINALNVFWLRTIWQNPLIYLKHRATIFAALFIGGSQYYYFSSSYIKGFEFHQNILFKAYHKFADLFVWKLNFLQQIYNQYHSKSKLVNHPVRLYVLFIGGIYWLVCLFVCIKAYLSRRKLSNFHAIFYIALSGFLYGAGYIFCAPTDEYRYWLWTVMAAIMCSTIYVRDLIRPS